MPIRRARVEDASAVFSLLWEARGDIPLRPQFYNDDNKKWIARLCDEGSVWVAEERQSLIGTMVVQGDEIFYLVVASGHRRRGIGGMLLSKVKRKRRWARVRPTNAAIIRLLESKGFRFDPDRLTASDWHAYRWLPPEHGEK